MVTENETITNNYKNFMMYLMLELILTINVEFLEFNSVTIYMLYVAMYNV